MFQLMYSNSETVKNSSVVIISIAIILFVGFLFTRFTKKIRLPNVTAYIIAGIIIGPCVFNIIPTHIIDGMDFLPDIALAFIAFSVGQYFKMHTIRKNFISVFLITLCESLLASLFIFVVTYHILKIEISFAIILSALGATTAPASTMLTIRQLGAKGHFVDMLLQVVAFDDVIGIIAYSIAISIALYFSNNSHVGGAHFLLEIAKPLFFNLFVIGLGFIFGLLLKCLLTSKRSTDNRLIIAIALLFAFCGLCEMLNLSPLLGCMVMGMTYSNVTNDDKLFKQLEYFSPPLLLLFFVRSGMIFDLQALVKPMGSIGSVPLIVVSVVYFALRIIGKYLGAFFGSLIARETKQVRLFLGLALVPQAGVVIGLSALAARILGGETGKALQTIILASSVLYELIGPASAKLSLYLSHSYTSNLEEVVKIPEVDDEGRKKTEIELLIERIQKIQEELPLYPVNEAELAYTEAAENCSIQSLGADEEKG